jgi:hypothetical protein
VFFDLHATVLRDYQDYVRSFFRIADDRARAFVDQALTDEARLWLPSHPGAPRLNES